jgi:hypothetical protein
LTKRDTCSLYMRRWAPLPLNLYKDHDSAACIPATPFSLSLTPAIAGGLKLAITGGGREESAAGHGDAGVAGELHAAQGESLSALRPYVVVCFP